jgi:hypothetical protein
MVKNLLYLFECITLNIPSFELLILILQMILI